MELDYDALEAKRTSIANFAERTIARVAGATPAASHRAIDAFTRLSPPTKPEMVFEYITVHSSGRKGGRSRKPGNIYLNWRKLMDIVPDVTIAGVGALSAPVWLAPLVALYVWNKLWRGAEEDLTDAEATILLALWKNRNSEDKISEDDGFAKTNSLRSVLAIPPLSKDEYVAAINRLLQMECIEINAGVIWLREWVRVTY